MDGHNSLLNLANRSGTCPRGIAVGQVRIRCNGDLLTNIASRRLKFTLISFIFIVRIFTKNKLLLMYTRRYIAWSRRILTSNKRNILSLHGCKHVWIILVMVRLTMDKCDRIVYVISLNYVFNARRRIYRHNNLLFIGDIYLFFTNCILFDRNFNRH